MKSKKIDVIILDKLTRDLISSDLEKFAFTKRKTRRRIYCMKSKIVLIAALSAATLALVGCGKAATTEQKTETVKADGVYTAQMDDASAEAAYGWRDQLEVEYKDGKVVSAVFESYDANGNKKSEVSPDVYPMDPAPADWMPQLSENITKAETAEKIDGVAGATMASNNARAMMAAIEASSEPDQVLVVAETAE